MTEPDEHAVLPCEHLPPLPQAEVKRVIEHERARVAADDDSDFAVESK